jgi:hypothetical protein
MSQGVAMAQLDSTGILYGEFQPGSVVEGARRSAARKISFELEELAESEITSLADAVTFLADLYRLCLRREVVDDPARSRKFKKNRAIAIFEHYRPQGEVEWLEDVVRQVDRLERKVARQDLDAKQVIDAVAKIALDGGIHPASRASAAITAYLLEVKDQREAAL